MNTQTKTINDVEYISIPDPGNAGCEGCVGYCEDNQVLCTKLSNGGECWEQEIKWIVNVTNKPTEEGRKFDNDKPQFALVPPMALIETVKVLTYGAQKYAPGNWRKVPDAKNRYFGAAMRHMWSWLKGEKVDPETGISHLAHALCSILFILELELEEA